MSHPFESISPHRLHTAFWLLAATTTILLTVEGTIYAQLTDPAAPLGILSLELASSPDRLNQVVGSWAEGPRSGMIFSLGLNFLCLFALTNTIAVACVIAAKRLRVPISSLGVLLAWAQWLAGAVWAVQNSLLAWGVFGHANRFTTALSASFSVAKFALVGMGVVYVVSAALMIGFRSRSLVADPETTL